MFVVSVCIYCVFFTETVDVVTAVVVGIFDTESRRVFKIFNKSVKKSVGACFDQTHASSRLTILLAFYAVNTNIN